MEYHPIKIIEPLIDFIKSCPFLGTDTQVGIMAFNPDMITGGNALMYSGTPKPFADKYVDGGVIVIKQANFMLYIRRPDIDEIFRLKTADFLYNFETWVEHENFLGSPPRYSNNEWSKERIWADNGAFWSDTETPGIIDYCIQIHIEYQLEYER